MSGFEYERLCVDFFSVLGYKDVILTKSGADQGIDLLAYKDGIDYGIQCKYYTNHVGNKAVQEAFAGSRFYGCEGSIVITLILGA